VEALVAMLFAVISAVEIGGRCGNLPGDAGLASSDAAGWIVAVYHLCLLCALVCVALIQWDGHCVPLRLTITVTAVGLVLPAVKPLLKPVTASGLLATDARVDPAAALVTGLVGAAAGVVLGVLAWPAAAAARPADDKTSNPSAHGSVLVAAFLGWQAAILLIALATTLTATAGRAVSRCQQCRALPWSAWLAASTLGYLLLWRTIAVELPWAVTEAGWGTFALATLYVLGVSAAVWTARQRHWPI
jgi:hypothetical protein